MEGFRSFEREVCYAVRSEGLKFLEKEFPKYSESDVHRMVHKSAEAQERQDRLGWEQMITMIIHW